MAKLPYMQFYPADYLRDTRCLSLAARGAWMDILCALWNSPKRGQRTLPIDGWAGEIGKPVEEVSAVIRELELKEIGKISRESDERITISSPRMMRDGRIQRLALKRKQKQRAESVSRSSHAPVTPLSRLCPINVTPKNQNQNQNQSQNQKEEEEKKKRESALAPTRDTVLESLERFRLTPELDAWAVKEGISNPGRYVEEFKDYWRSVGGRRKSGQPVKDWAAAFRNRLRQLKGMGKLLAVSDSLEERLRKWAEEPEVSV